jgi:hypothetical protein
MKNRGPLRRFLLAAATVWIAWCFPETPAGSAGVSDSLSAGYRRGLNADDWRGDFQADRLTASGIRLRISESVSSSRLEIPSEQDKWKDQHRLSLLLEKNLKPGWWLTLSGASQLFSDHQSYLEGMPASMNDIRTHSLEIGTRIRTGVFEIPGGIGPKQDRRFARTDNGVHYRAGLKAPFAELAGYAVRAEAELDADDLGPRKNSDLGIQAGVDRTFEEGVVDSVTAGWTRQRRDYYMSPEGDVESRNEQALSVSNLLGYRLSKNTGLRVYGSLTDRNWLIHSVVSGEKNKQRERKDFRAEGSAQLWIRTRRFSGSVSFGQTSEEQAYWIAENRRLSSYFGSAYANAPDNRGLLSVLSLRAGARPSPGDTVSWTASLQKLRYDTPDAENVDDRDELRFWTDVAARHVLSARLEFRLAASAHLVHQVYISGLKSADNNTMRILRLAPQVRWSPSDRIRIAQSAEVMANYVEYDFEAVVPGVRSFLYRKFQMEDTAWVDVSRGMSVYVGARLELDENGKLLWDEWLEQRLQDRASTTLGAHLDIRPAAGLHLIPGFTVYSRNGYRTENPDPQANSPSRVKDQTFRNWGPTLKVAYSGDRLLLSLSAATTRTETQSVSKQLLTRVDLNLSWKQ